MEETGRDCHGNPTALLTKVARNKAVDLIRRRDSRREREANFPRTTTETASHAVEYDELLESVLAKLNPSERELFERVIMKDEPITSVASGSGIPYPTVASQLRRLRLRLWQSLSSQSDS